MNAQRVLRCILALLAISLVSPISVYALTPEEVFVVANTSVSGSVDLAKYYMGQRGIPTENLVRIRTTNKEFCSRDIYDQEIAQPIRDFLEQGTRRDKVRCLVTMFGVPLKINPHAWTNAGKRQLEQLTVERSQVLELMEKKSDIETLQPPALGRRLAYLDKQIATLKKKNDRAAVDSELALLLRQSYPIDGWIANPYFVGNRNKSLAVKKSEVLFVARLDAPKKEIVRRMIDHSLAVEKNGLAGVAYFDGRWPHSENKPKNATLYYDNSIYQAADWIAKDLQMSVVVDDQAELFQPDSAPNAAIYCGWYSVNRYVDAFDWEPGAIGYHIASGECVTLRPGSGRGWCKGMLEDGVTATLGPVGEPYLQAFPLPELFFKLLTDGYYALGEVYFLSLPHLSWQMILVGDPLYRPFLHKGGTKSLEAPGN